MRANKFTYKNKVLEHFSDITMNLDKNPVTSQIARITNEESVATSIKNLILTNCTERFYNPTCGSKIQAGLFEPFDIASHDIIETTIKHTIEFYEPRATIVELLIVDDYDHNGVRVTIKFKIESFIEVYSVDVFVSRVR